MLKLCVNGARTPAEHPLLSADPADLLDDAVEAAALGAGPVHLHPKDRAGRDSLRAEDVARWVGAFRRALPRTRIGVTTGAWAETESAARIERIRSWTALPDFASVNWHEDGAEELASALLARGIAVEAGLWDAGAARAWVDSPLRRRCLRPLLEVQDLPTPRAAAEAHEMLQAVREGAPESVPLLHGEERSAWPVLRIAREQHLDTRIGLEDTLVLPDGTPAAGNSQLVVSVLRIPAAGAPSAALRLT